MGETLGAIYIEGDEVCGKMDIEGVPPPEKKSHVF
jgi:hypothetical protein